MCISSCHFLVLCLSTMIPWLILYCSLMNVFIFLQYIVDHQFSKLFIMEVFFCNYEGIVWLGMVIWVEYYFIVYNVLLHALPSFRVLLRNLMCYGGLVWLGVSYCCFLISVLNFSDDVNGEVLFWSCLLTF